MSRVIHFEIPADDPERAAAFYTEVFGWSFQRWEGPMEYWLISTGSPEEPGINGGLTRRPQPGAGPVNTIGVSSVGEVTAAVEQKGGKVTMPKSAIPGVGWLAYCEDPEGNPFGIMEADESVE